jgi:CDP-diacylglycerol--inositol 3-phosphatidyltransferase
MYSETTPIGHPFPLLAKYVPLGAKVQHRVATLTWAQLVALFTFPICVAKNIINVVQGWKASKILVGVDLAERARAREMVEEKED